MFGIFRRKKKQVVGPPATTGQGTHRPEQAPKNTVTLSWFLGLTGELADGSPNSIRFRENLESPNIRLAELEAWSLQALDQPQDEQKLNALQDLINSLAKRLDFQVRYGPYESQASDWLGFDGLWQIDRNLFATADIYSVRLEKIDFRALQSERDRLRRNQDWVSKADLVHLFLVTDGFDPRIEDEVRKSPFHSLIRILPLNTLYELLRMYQDRVIARKQLPILFRPLESIGVHNILDLIEEWSRYYEEPPDDWSSIPQSTDDPELPIAEEEAPKAMSFDDVLALFQSNDRERGEEELTAYLETHPSDGAAWEFWADLCLNRGGSSDAISALKHLLTLDPTQERILIKLAQAYKATQDYAGGLEALRPHAGPGASASLALSVAELLLLDGQADACREMCEKLVESEKNRSEPYVLWANACEVLGKSEDAIAALEKGLIALPKDATLTTKLEKLQAERKVPEKGKKKS